MSGKLIIMAGLAVVFGGTSYFAGNQYLEGQTQARIDQLENREVKNLELSQIVVSTKPLVFGERIGANDLKLIDWPKDNLPKGAYTTIKKAVGNGNRKVIQSIEPNEPVLNVKLTGNNGRAGLAGIIADGMRAVTIPVNTIDGVGGFVMPGDRVDIIFSQHSNKTGEQTAKVLMENVKVLTVDQQAGTRSNGPKVAKSVTLETDSTGAQRLALANNSGKLSLLLRGAGDNKSVSAEPISLNEDIKKKSLLSFLNGPQKEAKTTSVKVVAGKDVLEKTVPIQKVLNTSSKK